MIDVLGVFVLAALVVFAVCAVLIAEGERRNRR